jgi:hypothetical protein
MDALHFDYQLTEQALSAMWGVRVVFGKPGESSVRLTPLNMHFEGLKLHDRVDCACDPVSELIQKARLSSTKELRIATDLIAPQFDYDFSHIVDSGKFYRGPMEYKRPCGWKRLGIDVKGVYDGGHNGWLSLKAREGVWVNSYLPTDFAKLSAFLQTEASYLQTSSTTFGYDVAVISMPDLETAQQFAQSVQVAGVQYKFVFQNRVNPKALQSCCQGQVYLCPREAIRPYGLLIKRESVPPMPGLSA